MNTTQADDISEKIFALIRDDIAVTNRTIRVACGRGGPHAYSQTVDAAMQKLRKAGRIRFDGKRWRLANTKPCSHCRGTGYVKEQP